MIEILLSFKTGGGKKGQLGEREDYPPPTILPYLRKLFDVGYNNNLWQARKLLVVYKCLAWKKIQTFNLSGDFIFSQGEPLFPFFVFLFFIQSIHDDNKAVGICCYASINVLTAAASS